MKSKIVNECCLMFEIHPRDLLGPAKFSFCTRPRFALYKALHLRGWSAAAIGRFVGGRDHSTVLHGLNRADYMMERDPEFARQVVALAALQRAEKEQAA